MGAARQFVKSAGIGTTVGILGGLASGRGDDKLRSAGRGAIKGMGFDVGAGMGGALGGALGMATLNPALGVAGLVGGGLGGGMLGQSLASSAIGPYETEEEKFERMLAAREAAQLKLKNKEKAAMSFYSFGAKIANYVDLHNEPKPAKKQLPQHEVFNNALARAEAAGEKPSPELFARIQKEHDDAQKTEKKSKITGMTFDPDNANVKKLKAQHPNNWRQVMAKSQGLSDSSRAKAIKKAQSACSPCAMPNGPKNKPYTSASPAVTDASQKSVEIGKPPVTETEHSEAKAKQPEEGAKSAYAFGAKVAAGIFTPTGLQGDDKSYASGVANERANLFLGDSEATQTNLLAGNKLMDDQRIKLRHLNALRHDVASYKKPTALSVTGDAFKNWGRNIYNAGDATAKRIWRTGEDIASYGGPRNALDSVIDSTVNVTHGIAGLPGKALRAATGGGISPQAMAGAGTGPGGSSLSGGSTPAAGAETAPATAGGGMMDYLTNPYVLGGGVGALGLGGLLYYLNSQPKKKKRDEEEEV
jgi:hypothetical protein